MTAEQKLYNMFGLAMKAGKLKSGEFSTEKAVKEGKACLVITAADASDNTKKMFRNMCDYYHVPYYIFGEKERLGSAIGAHFRASVACIDEHFASTLISQLQNLP